MQYALKAVAAVAITMFVAHMLHPYVTQAVDAFHTIAHTLH